MGSHFMVLRSFKSHAAGYLAAEVGERIEITCEKIEDGDHTDEYEHYVYGRKLEPVGKGEEGWLPYCKDVIQIDIQV